MDVVAASGTVALIGSVQAHELRGLLENLSAIRGVERVECRLEVIDAGRPVRATQVNVRQQWEASGEKLRLQGIPFTEIAACMLLASSALWRTPAVCIVGGLVLGLLSGGNARRGWNGDVCR
jgi:hypothetical protein